MIDSSLGAAGVLYSSTCIRVGSHSQPSVHKILLPPRRTRLRMAALKVKKSLHRTRKGSMSHYPPLLWWDLVLPSLSIAWQIRFVSHPFGVMRLLIAPPRRSA